MWKQESDLAVLEPMASAGRATAKQRYEFDDKHFIDPIPGEAKRTFSTWRNKASRLIVQGRKREVLSRAKKDGCMLYLTRAVDDLAKRPAEVQLVRNANAMFRAIMRANTQLWLWAYARNTTKLHFDSRRVYLDAWRMFEQLQKTIRAVRSAAKRMHNRDVIFSAPSFLTLLHNIIARSRSSGLKQKRFITEFYTKVVVPSGLVDKTPKTDEEEEEEDDEEEEEGGETKSRIPPPLHFNTVLLMNDILVDLLRRQRFLQKIKESGRWHDPITREDFANALSLDQEEDDEEEEEEEEPTRIKWVEETDGKMFLKAVYPMPIPADTIEDRWVEFKERIDACKDAAVYMTVRDRELAMEVLGPKRQQLRSAAIYNSRDDDALAKGWKSKWTEHAAAMTDEVTERIIKDFGTSLCLLPFKAENRQAWAAYISEYLTLGRLRAFAKESKLGDKLASDHPLNTTLKYFHISQVLAIKGDPHFSIFDLVDAHITKDNKRAVQEAWAKHVLIGPFHDNDIKKEHHAAACHMLARIVESSPDKTICMKLGKEGYQAYEPIPEIGDVIRRVVTGEWDVQESVIESIVEATSGRILPDSRLVSREAFSCSFTWPIRGSTACRSSQRNAPVVNRTERCALRRDLNRGNPAGLPFRFPFRESPQFFSARAS